MVTAAPDPKGGFVSQTVGSIVSKLREYGEWRLCGLRPQSLDLPVIGSSGPEIGLPGTADSAFILCVESLFRYPDIA